MFSPDEIEAARTIPALDYRPPSAPLDILHKDDHLLVLNKPVGLLSVPGRGDALQDSLELRAKAEFPQALLVHRLDMDTSGIFIMAMNKNAQRILGLQFEKRQTDKRYIARVWGILDEDEGLVDLPLRCDWDRRPLQMVCYEHGKSAQTQWKVLERDQNQASTLVELTPITGRSHQLRVHMATLGHPILGDCFYAPDDALEAADRLLLHAQSLEINHPDGGDRVCFSHDISL